MIQTDMDMVLQRHTPVVVVPKFGEFVPMVEDGHRFLVCGDGLWVECRRKWIHAILPMARQFSSAMPFGCVRQTIELAFDAIPSWAILRFHEEARRHHPKEVGALVTWNESTGEFEYHQCRVLRNGVGHLTQAWPALPEGVWPVLDLHSHGPLGAFFSSQDRLDTGMEVIVAGVIGRLSDASPQIALSLFACGVEVRVSIPVEIRNQFVDARAQGAEKCR